MGRTYTNPDDINTLKDLLLHKSEVKAEYLHIESSIKADISYKVKHPMTLFKRKKQSASNDQSTTNFVANTAAKMASGFVKKLLPAKTGFLKKAILGFLAKKTVKAVVNKKLNTGAEKSEGLIALPIARKLNVINEPSSSNNMDNKAVDGAAAQHRTKKKLSFKGLWQVIKRSFGGFSDHKVTKLSGSLAYYTVFSMAPLLVVVIALCGVFLEKEAAQGEIYAQLKGFLGTETAAQLQELIEKAAIGDKGIIASIIGGVTLLVGATSIFADIQDSINTIWGIKPKPKRGWLKLLQNRFLSFSVIVSLGFLLLVSLMVSTVLDGFSERLEARFADVSVMVFTVINLIVTFLVVSLIFGVIFKVLPDAKIRWRDVASGAMVTAVLFMLGKFAISFYIGQSDVGSTYGAAGSLVILLLWAYYSSIILYFGAEFTKAYAMEYGAEIHPAPYAVTLKEVEVEEGNNSIQKVEQQKQAEQN